MGKWAEKFKSIFDDVATIQYLDSGGNWTVVSQCSLSDPGVVDLQLRQAQEAHPGHRVRAIDGIGRLVDIA